MIPPVPSLLCLLALATPPPLNAQSVIAHVMVDRYRDGAPNLGDVDAAHVRRFQGGDLRGLRDALPYLKALGVSHVLITPLHKQIGHHVGAGADATAAYHGYWPEDFTAVDAHFGDDNDVRALVDAAAADGIGVILDVVVNHTGYGASDPRGLVRRPCGEGDQQSCLFGLPDLRTEDPRVRAAVVDDVRWWLRLAPFAGVRLDAFKHIDNDTARAITAAVHEVRPGAAVIAERWGAGPDDDAVIADVAGAAADTAFDFTVMGSARDFLVGRMRGEALAHHVQRRARAPLASQLITFLDNHDTETWAHAVADRAPLGAFLLVAQPGVPSITWGAEVGRAGGPSDPTCRSFMPWHDVAAAEEDPDSALHVWRKLVALRRTSTALATGTTTATGAPGLVAIERRSDVDRVVVLVGATRAAQHCVGLRAGEEVTDIVAWPRSRARADLVGQTLCLRTGTATGGGVAVRVAPGVRPR